jgi:hypothetical protein
MAEGMGRGRGSVTVTLRRGGEGARVGERSSSLRRVVASEIPLIRSLSISCYSYRLSVSWCHSRDHSRGSRRSNSRSNCNTSTSASTSTSSIRRPVNTSLLHNISIINNFVDVPIEISPTRLVSCRPWTVRTEEHHPTPGVLHEFLQCVRLYSSYSTNIS